MTDRLEEARSLHEQGRELMKAGHSTQAIACFEKSVACAPHFKTLELLGEAYLQSGEPKKAIVPLARVHESE